MIFLQAAMVYGMVLLAILGISVFVALPVFTIIAYIRLKRMRQLADTSKEVIWLLAALVGIVIVVLLLFLLWVFVLNKVGLSTS